MRKASLAFSWIAANAVSQAVALVLAAILTARLLAGVRPLGITPDSADPIVTPVQLLVVGAVLGTAQWMALRGHLQAVGRWVPLTILGALGASPVRVAIDGTFRTFLHHKPAPVEALIWALLLGLALGLGLGLAQWALLRRNFPRAAIWLLAATLGGGIGASFEMALRISGVTQSAAGFTGYDALSGLANGLAFAAVTGLALLWLVGTETPSGDAATSEDSSLHSHLARPNPDGILQVSG